MSVLETRWSRFGDLFRNTVDILSDNCRNRAKTRKTETELWGCIVEPIFTILGLLILYNNLSAFVYISIHVTQLQSAISQWRHRQKNASSPQTVGWRGCYRAPRCKAASVHAEKQGRARKGKCLPPAPPKKAWLKSKNVDGHFALAWRL